MDWYPYYTSSTGTTTTTNLVYGTNYKSWTPTPFKPHLDPLVLGEFVGEAAAIPENDLAWLKRRISEICWRPV